jgi:hypothetical protein
VDAQAIKNDSRSADLDKRLQEVISLILDQNAAVFSKLDDRDRVIISRRDFTDNLIRQSHNEMIMRISQLAVASDSSPRARSNIIPVDMELVHRYGESVLSTWETSFSAVVRRSPVASRLLTLLAFLNFDDIFLDLFSVEDTSKEVSAAKGPADDLSWQMFLSPESSDGLGGPSRISGGG